MKNIYIVVRDVSGKVTCSDVMEGVTGEEAMDIRKFIEGVFSMKYFTMEVDRTDVVFNPNNVVSVTLEEFDHEL